MTTNITELVFILDRSGSMGGLEKDTIGGFNAMLDKQKQEKGQARVTTALFDNSYELLHDRLDLQAVMPITDQDYYVRGSTALLDAIARSVMKVDSVMKATTEQFRPDKVLFVIITDGMENASREYSYAQVKQLVERQKETYGWEFIFLGANIDAIATAATFGISADRAANYHADSQGTQLNYEAVGCAVSEFRTSRQISDRWKARIDEDFKKRGKKHK